jgi:hypothetical protein
VPAAVRLRHEHRKRRAGDGDWAAGPAQRLRGSWRTESTLLQLAASCTFEGKPLMSELTPGPGPSKMKAEEPGAAQHVGAGLLLARRAKPAAAPPWASLR